MGTSQRVFRVFVSSTFADLTAERDALQRHVFPALREHCARAGYGFQAIDLRWGIGREASLDQRTMRICLDELARCQRLSPRPNFIVLLADRYGWRPLPEDVDAEEFARVLEALPAEDRTLAEEWYRRDDNAVPPVFRLQPRSGTSADWDVWADIEARLHAALRDAAATVGLAEDALAKYRASATEQEILHGALEVPDAAEHVFCFFRQTAGEAPAAAAAAYSDTLSDGSADEEAREALTALKSQLRDRLPGHTFDYPARWEGAAPSADHIEQLAADVRDSLLSVIAAEIATLEAVPHLEREIAAHAAFAEERSAGFTGRVEYLHRIAEYLAAPGGQPLVVWGEGGSGKSALLARAVRDVPGTGAVLVQRYVGATPSSADVRALLTDACSEIGAAFGVGETPPTDFQELVGEFRARLDLASEARPLLIVLDSLDQLAEAHGARGLAWLPTSLPPGVGMVLSTRPGEELAALRRTVPDERILRLEEMGADEGEALLDTWLAGVRRALTGPQRDEVLSSFAKCGLPLHLRLSFDEASRWASYDDPIDLGDDIAAIVSDLYDRLEHDHGRALVGHALAYLAITRETAGLAEDELLDALSRDETVFGEFLERAAHTPPEKRIPVVVWARLYADLERYLSSRESEGAQLLTFFHRELAEEARQRYAGGEDGAPELHAVLSAVFEAQGDPPGDRSWQGRPRALAELPYHLTAARDWDALFATLTDFTFLERKAAEVGVVEGRDAEGNEMTTYTGVFALLDDYDRALEVYPEE